jgi:hypothetical protein
MTFTMGKMMETKEDIYFAVAKKEYITVVKTLFWLHQTLALLILWLQSLKDLGHLTYGRFLKLFRHLVDSLDGISACHKAYTHTGQHNTWTNIHTLGWNSNPQS